MGSSHLHVVWDNHISNLQTVLYEFYNRHSLADVTISCKDGTLKAHKIILSACSPYFETVFQENPCEHPVIILKEISCYEMQILLQLMYRGSTDVPEEDISDIIQTANELKVKGFVQAAVKNVTEDTDRLENDSGMDQHNLSNVLPITDENEYQDDSELHAQEDTRQNVANYGLEDDVECSNGFVDINNFVSTSDSVDKPTSEVNQAIMISSPRSMAELKCKSMKRHQRKNGLKARKKVVELQDSLSWSSEDDEMLCDQPSKNDESTLNASSNAGSSLQPRPNFTDKPARKELRYESAADKFIHMIPEIQIKEEHIDAVDYSVMSTHCDTRNYDTDTMKHSACGNPVNTHTSCNDISDVTTLVRRSEIAAKPHECEYCGLAFARASHLARHRRVHTGERPFTCFLCQRKFTRQDKLRLHVMKYHALDIKDGKHQNYLLTQKVSSGANSAATEDELRDAGRGDSSLPFGDTSYLSSISFGLQKHTDSTVGAAETLDANADELLFSVRQLGECTIQAVTKQQVNS